MNNLFPLFNFTPVRYFLLYFSECLNRLPEDPSDKNDAEGGLLHSALFEELTFLTSTSCFFFHVISFFVQFPPHISSCRDNNVRSYLMCPYSTCT